MNKLTPLQNTWSDKMVGVVLSVVPAVHALLHRNAA